MSDRSVSESKDTVEAIFDLQVALLAAEVNLKEAEGRNLALSIELHECRTAAETDQRRGLRLALAYESSQVENARLLSKRDVLNRDEVSHTTKTHQDIWGELIETLRQCHDEWVVLGSGDGRRARLNEAVQAFTQFVLSGRRT